jgi:hypothetical protein
MKSYQIIALAAFVAGPAFVTSCKKEDNARTTCSSTLYGYYKPDTAFTPPTGPLAWGVIDASTATLTSASGVANSGYSNQGAYNTADNCYYVFKYGSSSRTDTLYKVSAGGVVTTYSGAANQALDGLVFNPTNNKLYCLRRTITGTTAGPTEIVEITTSGTSFTATTVATTTNQNGSASPATSTVDPATGYVFFALKTHNPETYAVEQYIPGSSTSSVIVAGTDKRVMGLRYNRNNNMLYATTENHPATTGPYTYSFVQISPASSTMTTLATLPFDVNNEFYTCGLDACSDRYVLSTISAWGWGYITNTLTQIDMSGAVVLHDTTAGLYQGMAIRQ